MIRWIDEQLLGEVSREAEASPRGRKNRNLHPCDDHPAHRLLNAIEPGSYVRPHRHLDAGKDETMVVLRGRLGVVEFDDAGLVLRAGVLAAGSPACGVDIGYGSWHTVFALEPGTVFLEAKAGPYRPLIADETAQWAPAEGSPEAAAYLAILVAGIRSPQRRQ